MYGENSFQGLFDYEEKGVLDRGYLRFFGLPNLLELFAENGMYVEKLERNIAPMEVDLHCLTRIAR